MNETVTVFKDVLVGWMNSLGEAISTAAPEAWRIMIKQQYVEGLGFIIGIIACIIISIVTWKLGGGRYKKAETTRDWSDSYDLKGFGGFLRFVSVIAFMLIWIFMFQAVAHFINPEYYAILSIAKMAGLIL